MVRALATGPDLLLLDEVLAGLNPQETEEMAAIVRGLARDLGLAILLIEHNVRAVMALSERVVVLGSGRSSPTASPPRWRATRRWWPRTWASAARRADDRRIPSPRGRRCQRMRHTLPVAAACVQGCSVLGPA